MPPLRRDRGRKGETRVSRPARRSRVARSASRRTDDRPAVREAVAPRPLHAAVAPVSPMTALHAMREDGAASISVDRVAAEDELARWPHRLPYSIRRIVVATGEGQTPGEALADWMRANCRGAWCLINVPGGTGFVCMRDAACASEFAFAFG